MKPASLIGIWCAGVLAGGLLGALTNAVNAQVSPAYFRTVMGWKDVEELTRAIIAQGVFEGLAFGLFLSTVLTIVVGIVSRAGCPFLYGARYLAYLMTLALGCWIVGGLVAILLAGLSPEFFARTFRGVPEEAAARLRYAWVGGSIWGIQFGGAAAVAVVAVLFGAAWKRRHGAPPPASREGETAARQG